MKDDTEEYKGGSSKDKVQLEIRCSHVIRILDKKNSGFKEEVRKTQMGIKTDKI